MTEQERLADPTPLTEYEKGVLLGASYSHESVKKLIAVYDKREKALQQALQGLAEALLSIEKWFGEFPETGHAWDDGSPMSYGAAFGSNGERDFMRKKASIALEVAKPFLEGKR